MCVCGYYWEETDPEAPFITSVRPNWCGGEYPSLRDAFSYIVCRSRLWENLQVVGGWGNSITAMSSHTDCCCPCLVVYAYLQY